jgi:integrase/recombinase XerD
MTILRQRMSEDMQVRNLSPNTQLSYLQQVSLFARHFGESPAVLGPEEIRAYQIYLTNEKKLCPGSIHIAVAALRFLYKVTLKKSWTLGDVLPLPKKQQKLPIVLSPEEVQQFLECVQSIKHRTILTTCYAAGMRISEAVHLKPDAIDSKRMVIRVVQGKGQKDRYGCSRPSCWKRCASTGERGDRTRSGSSLAIIAVSRSPGTPWGMPARRRTVCPDCPSPSRPIA